MRTASRPIIKRTRSPSLQSRRSSINPSYSYGSLSISSPRRRSLVICPQLLVSSSLLLMPMSVFCFDKLAIHSFHPTRPRPIQKKVFPFPIFQLSYKYPFARFRIHLLSIPSLIHARLKKATRTKYQAYKHKQKPQKPNYPKNPTPMSSPIPPLYISLPAARQTAIQSADHSGNRGQRCLGKGVRRCLGGGWMSVSVWVGGIWGLGGGWCV